MRTPMACCDSISREEQISRVSLKRTSTRSPCGSINARGKPWDSKLLPIDYKRCCSDQLNPPHLADILRCASHVRFTPNSGHLQRTSPCPLCATSGLMQCSKLI